MGGMLKRSVDDLKQMKVENRKIAMLTAYDYPTAKFVADAGADMILVGDSLGMVVLGFRDTREVTMDIMVTHVGAVRRGAPEIHIVGDMPIHSYDTPEAAAANAQRLVEAGADTVKMEGRVLDAVRAVRAQGIEVMGHVGVLPQSTGTKLRGRDPDDAQAIQDDARSLESCGCYAIVIENSVAGLGRQVSEVVDVPTIGIGAGPDTDGQVLIVHDVLGMFERFTPPFAKRYAELAVAAREACSAYVEDVRAGRFPDTEHTRE
jgi:3-methyl-2-oxobutanoate hydroxymethyltransferase